MSLLRSMGCRLKDLRELASAKIGAMAPGSSTRLGILRKGEQKFLTLTLGQLPGERQAQVGFMGSENE